MGEQSADPPQAFFERIRRAYARELARQGGDSQGLLTVIAHSLGSVIASDGLYEHLKSGTFPANLRLAHVVTLGSPIALYGLRYSLDRFTRPIRPEMWLNVYFPQDLIGFPLRALNEAYAEAVTEDLGLRPGGGMSVWSGALRWILGQIPIVNTLLSHGWYFTDRRVVRRIATLLAGQRDEPVPHTPELVVPRGGGVG